MPPARVMACLHNTMSHTYETQPHLQTKDYTHEVPTSSLAAGGVPGCTAQLPCCYMSNRQPPKQTAVQDKHKAQSPKPCMAVLQEQHNVLYSGSYTQQQGMVDAKPSYTPPSLLGPQPESPHSPSLTQTSPVDHTACLIAGSDLRSWRHCGVNSQG